MAGWLGARPLVRRGLRRGLVGGHRGWQAVLLVAALARLLRALARRGPGRVVHTERVPVGGVLEVRHLPPGDASGSGT